MGCNCNSPINSWIDWQNTDPKDPMDLISYATLNSVVGSHSNSSVIVIPGGAYVANSWSYGTPSVSALETDNQQMVADAAMWNFQHQMLSPASFLAPPLQKVIFLRGGTQWLNTIPLNVTGADPFSVLELTFRDNAGTRGDAQGTVPVIAFSGNLNNSPPARNLTVTLKAMSGRVNMILRAKDSGGAISVFEMEWIIVP